MEKSSLGLLLRVLNWKEIVQNYITRHSDKIQRTTRPIRERFGVDYFSYHRIDNDGKYTVLVDRPDWAESYVSCQMYLKDPYLRHPDVYKSGLCLVDSQGSPEYREEIMKFGKSVLNIDLGVIQIEKAETAVEFFCYTGSKKRSSLESLYINHPHLLTSFSAYFKQELKSILISMEHEAGSLLDLKGSDFLCDELISPKIDFSDQLAYLDDLGLHSLILQAKKLTSREWDCLQGLLMGETAKETANRYQLSHRTIESYFETIKQKLSCTSKYELLTLAQQLESFGLIP
jgi:DNA-binding CsgD family transcriptional regulator